jgi:NTP pyrophosphatase (non-canonical NTP hydrolase)
VIGSGFANAILASGPGRTHRSQIWTQPFGPVHLHPLQPGAVQIWVPDKRFALSGMTIVEGGMPVETSNSIRDWGDAAFGEVSNLSALVSRARGELDELEQAIRAGDRAEIGREAADVAILLHRLVALAGMDLAAEVDAKMAVNRARKWKAAGDGTGGHV